MAVYSYAQTLAGVKNAILTGPNTFAYLVIDLPNGRQKKIVMMGEDHTPFSGCGYMGNCVTMINYIMKLSSVDGCLDVFMEDTPAKDQGYRQTHYRQKDPPEDYEPSISTLNLTRKFTRYISSQPNVRVHNWDLRFRDIGTYEWINLYSDLLVREGDTFSKMSHFDREYFTRYLMGYDVDYHRFEQILKHLNWKSGKETLVQVNILVNKIKGEYRKFQKTEAQYFPGLRDKYLSYILQVYYANQDMYFIIILTDFYLLLRMFRSFGDKEKGSCIGIPYSDKIVLYGGYVHINNIFTFLRLYFDCIRYVARSGPESKFISFTTNTIQNIGGYRNFGDFLSWPD